VNAIKLAAGLLPALFILLAAGVMLAYPLTEAGFREITQAIANRRAAASTRA
jgi:Na+/melibiose symporter-like transporter